MKLREWAKNIWNHLDASSAILFYVGFAFTFYNENLSKPILAISLLLFYVKLAKFFRIFSTLGPYLVMIYRMVRNLLYLFSLLQLSLSSSNFFIKDGGLSTSSELLSANCVHLLLEHDTIPLHFTHALLRIYCSHS